MSADRISAADLRRALEAHVACLERVGIEYEGRLGLDEGSKVNGIAFRLYRTGYPVPCSSTIVHLSTCSCGGKKYQITTGHARPPVGDDFLGMTKSEAYETLTARTRAIYDTASALERP